MDVKVYKAQKQGWLSIVNKKKKLLKGDKQYWFALDESNLYYFTDDTVYNLFYRYLFHFAYLI